MRIAIVVRNLSSARGGLERYALETVRGLVARGHDVEVYAHTWDGQEIPGVRYHRVPTVRKPAWLQALTFHWGVNKRLVRAQYDIVMGSGVVLFWPQQVYRMSGGTVAASLRRRYPHPLRRALAMLLRPVLFVNWWMERRLMMGRVDYVLANSKWAQMQALEELGVPPERTTVIHNGYDPQRFAIRQNLAFRQAFRRRCGMHDDAIVLLFVSQNFKLKGLDLLIAALPAVVRKNPRTWLVVVGKDKPGPFLAQAREHGVERRIFFVGASDVVED
jgi:UDP-glucose:(heptosyl)LPS alpha-1,3-glucosyltransferase